MQRAARSRRVGRRVPTAGARSGGGGGHGGVPQRGTAAVLRWTFPWTMLSASEGCAPRAHLHRNLATVLADVK